MKYSDKLKAMRADKIKAAKAITAKADAENRVMSAEETKAFEALHSEAVAIRAQIVNAEAQEAADSEIVALVETPANAGHQNTPRANREALPMYADFMARPTPQPKMWGRLRNAPDAKTAYRFGMWLGAALGFAWAKAKAKDMFEPLTLLNESTNTQGGYLVIEEFINTMIDLREKYGVFRRKSKIVPMNSDKARMPRRTGGLTAYPVGEGQTGTESTKTWDSVGLVATKWMALTRMTSEVNEDSVIAFGDDMLGEIAYAFAVAEDGAGFNGDGTSTYAGITGLKNALNAGSLQTQGTSNTWAAQVLSDINNLMSLVPDYTQAPNPEFYCNKAYYHQVLERLAMAGGGNTGIIIAQGIPQGVFFGTPVNFVAAMPNATATTQQCLYYGDLGASSKFGDRRIMTLSMSTEASVGGQSMWERDEIGIKGTERFDINIHERGTATKGGPIVGLKTS